MSGLALALALVLSTVSGQAEGQTGAEPGAAERLEQLTRVEQGALDTGDAAQILSSGRQLGSLALRLLGDVYAGQGRFALASDAYGASVLADDSAETREARVETGLLLLATDLRADRAEGARKAAEEIVGIGGDTAHVHLLIANAWHSGDDLAGTIAELSRAVELDGQISSAHLALGDAFWQLNEYQYNPDSLREFAAAQRLSPGDFLANEDLGAVLSQYERYDQAAVCLRAAAAADPASPDPWLQMGMNAYAQGRAAEALAALRKAVELTGADEARNGYQIRRGYAVMSRMSADQGRAAEAQQFAEHEERLHAAMLRADVPIPLSESTGLVQNHALKARKAAGAVAGAEAVTEQQKEVERQLRSIAAKGLNDAGTVLARQRDYGGALPLFRTASTADPGLQPVMRNLGLAAFHTGAYGEAVAALGRALEQNPEDALVRSDLEQARALLTAAPATPGRP